MFTGWDVLLVLGVFVLASLLAKLFERHQLNKQLPPGPIGLPILGVFPWLVPARNAYLTLTKWASDYGNVFSFYNGGQLYVVLADYQSIKATLLKQAEAFTGRPRVPMAKYTRNDHGLVASNGALWREQRRFALSTLRDLGLGKPIMENKIMEESEVLVEELAKLNSEPFDPQYLLSNVVSNVICALVFGHRFDYRDEKFQKLMDGFNFLLTRSGQNIFSLVNVFPSFIIANLPGSAQKVIAGRREIEEFCSQLIQEHKDRYQPENEPEDYIHAYMAAGEMAKDSPYFYDLQLLQSVFSLFGAGTETTATTLRWAILILAEHQEIQEKIRKEISDVVGHGNLPSLKDRPSLPYTEAAIYEVQRIANLVPFLARRAVVDSHVDGYLIPKEATVLPLLWMVHRDPEFFPEPEEFNPDRFIENGKTIKTDALIPFSVGKRACLGESLAKMELFLFFTALFQKFRFELPNSEVKTKKHEDGRVVGVTTSPRNFKVSAIPL